MLLGKQHTKAQRVAQRYATQTRRNSRHYRDVRATLRRVIGLILNRRNRATAKSGNWSGCDAEISESRLELCDVLRDVNAIFSRRFVRRCV